jgi:hypothetical protein
VHRLKRRSDDSVLRRAVDANVRDCRGDASDLRGQGDAHNYGQQTQAASYQAADDEHGDSLTCSYNA